MHPSQDIPVRNQPLVQGTGQHGLVINAQSSMVTEQEKDSKEGELEPPSA